MDDSPTVHRFIVGMPRAATTWLCKCLNEHPDAVAFGESMFWGRKHLPPRSDGTYDAPQVEAIRRTYRDPGWLADLLGDGPGLIRHLDATGWPPLLDEAFAALPANPSPAATWTALCMAIGSGGDGRLLVEKTPHHVNWIDRILTHLPGARFVVMVREPWDFMLSYKHIGDRKDDAVRRRFRRRYHPLGCAVVWRGCMAATLAARRDHPGSVLVVPFEDVRDRSGQVLKQVQSFYDLSVMDLAGAVPQDNTSFPGSERPGLRGDDVFWMNQVAGGIRRDAGFPGHPTPREPLRVLWSLLRLPWWAMRNFLGMRSIISGSATAYLWRWIRPGRKAAAT